MIDTDMQLTLHDPFLVHAGSHHVKVLAGWWVLHLGLMNGGRMDEGCSFPLQKCPDVVSTDHIWNDA